MLDRLKTFVLVSDVEKMNRPVTYGRSLRAAALATYDRPADRAVLKEDVAWLVQASSTAHTPTTTSTTSC